MPANDPHGRRFGEVADAYDRGRPSYPSAAVDWLLADVPQRVLDLGAGTGKLTQLLVDRCAYVVAVEPSDGMRAVLSAKLTGVEVLAGTAEDIPLPDGSVDTIVVGQAWHWVDPIPASSEAARVLTPEGVLGLVWNDRDETDPWIAGLTSLLQQYGTAPDLGYQPIVGAPFGDLEEFAVSWTNDMTPSEVVDMVVSRSYVIALPEAARAELVARLDDHLQTANRSTDGRVRVPYVTHAFRARRTDQ